MGANTASLNKRGKFDKSLIAVIMPLAWPTILEQALQTIVQFIDSAMVGRISANASAAVGLTQTVTWLLSGLFFAAGVGFLAVISRAIGADDRDYAQRTAGQAVVVAVIMGLVIGGCGYGFELCIADLAWRCRGNPQGRDHLFLYYQCTDGFPFGNHIVWSAASCNR